MNAGAQGFLNMHNSLREPQWSAEPESCQLGNLTQDPNCRENFGPGARTLRSQCQGPGFDPWSGNWISEAEIKTRRSQKQKQKRTTQQTAAHLKNTLILEKQVIFTVEKFYVHK